MFDCDICGRSVSGDTMRPVCFAVGSTGHACPECAKTLPPWEEGSEWLDGSGATQADVPVVVS